MLSYYFNSVRKGKKKLRRLVHERPKKCVFSAKKNYRSHNGVADMEVWLPADVFRF